MPLCLVLSGRRVLTRYHWEHHLPCQSWDISCRMPGGVDPRNHVDSVDLEVKASTLAADDKVRGIFLSVEGQCLPVIRSQCQELPVRHETTSSCPIGSCSSSARRSGSDSNRTRLLQLDSSDGIRTYASAAVRNDVRMIPQVCPRTTVRLVFQRTGPCKVTDRIRDGIPRRKQRRSGLNVLLA